MLNVKIFCIAEVFILIFALLLAVIRGPAGAGVLPAARARDRLRGLLPRRADDPRDRDPRLRRAGAPACGACRRRSTFWGIVALVLVYTAYVSEVYRAGIESVHPSQEAAARSLGLTRMQALRFVVLPQAVRRVIPPLLNDFIGLQKDTALVGTLGAIEAFNQAADRHLRDLQLHAVPGRGRALRRDHDPARALHRLADPPRPPAAPVGGRARVTDALRLDGVRKSFDRNVVLRGIDLDVAEHEVVCLIGASGSGKSTLLRCVNLIEPIDAGRIVVEGEEITRARASTSNRVRRRIGIVFQAFNLFPHMTVLRNVTLAPRDGARAARAPSAEARALELLARFGLADKARRVPRPALGRPAAARRDRARARDAARADAARRGDERARPGARRRGARGDPRARRRRDDDADRHARDELRARDRRPRLLPRRRRRSSSRARRIEIFGAPREPRTQQFLQRIVAAGRL